MTTSFQIGPETFYVFSYRAFDAEGDPAGEPDTVGAVFGTGQILALVEAHLEGRGPGPVPEFRLAAEQSFGSRKQSAILEVDRADFPPDVAPGDRFDVENFEGGLLVVQVLEVGEDFVVIDTNHPLADQEVTIRGEVLEVRPATEQELRAAEVEMEEDLAHGTAPAPDVGTFALVRKARAP